MDLNLYRKWRESNDARQETVFAWLMSLSFFVTIAVFWILKPLKKGLFIETYASSGVSLAGWDLSAAKAELIAKELNLVVAFVAMSLFVFLSRHLRKHRLQVFFGAVMAFAFVLFSQVLRHSSSDFSVWAFYMFGDLFNMLMIAALFSFLNDAVSVSQSKRLYGPVVLGGVCGGAFGSIAVRAWLSHLSLPGWMLICAGSMLPLMAASLLAGRIASRNQRFGTGTPVVSVSPKNGGVFVEGARTVSRSAQLLSIAGIVALYETVSSIIDYQFTHTVVSTLSGGAVSRHFATTYMVMNMVALVVQLFVSRRLMTRLGVRRAIIILPLFLLLGSTGFMAAPGLFFASFLLVGDNGLNYSLHQSCRESLYVMLPSRDKYSGKAFIDIFVQRLAKGVGLLIPILVSSSMLRWLSAVSIPLIALWTVVASRAGSRLDERDEERMQRAREEEEKAA